MTACPYVIVGSIAGWSHGESTKNRPYCIAGKVYSHDVRCCKSSVIVTFTVQAFIYKQSTNEDVRPLKVLTLRKYWK